MCIYNIIAFSEPHLFWLLPQIGSAVSNGQDHSQKAHIALMPHETFFKTVPVVYGMIGVQSVYTRMRDNGGFPLLIYKLIDSLYSRTESVEVCLATMCVWGQ